MHSEHKPISQSTLHRIERKNTLCGHVSDKERLERPKISQEKNVSQSRS